jgi:putative NADH-flavin reductase
MRILVLGASGGTGQQVVEQALGHGHQVVAFVRDPGRLSFVHERLTVIAGDVTDAVAVQTALERCDCVISTLGSRGQRPVSVYSDGIANAIRAMTARGIRRLVVVSAAGAGTDSEDAPLRVRMMRKMSGLRPVYEDMERMEGDVMLSDLDWTIVRAAALRDGPLTGIYRVVEGNAVPKGTHISRADLAALLLKCATGGFYVRRAVAVAY